MQIDDDKNWEYKFESEVTSLDDIYQRFHNGYYHSIGTLEEALV
jgi:hypothetical protein